MKEILHLHLTKKELSYLIKYFSILFIFSIIKMIIYSNGGYFNAVLTYTITSFFLIELYFVSLYIIGPIYSLIPRLTMTIVSVILYLTKIKYPFTKTEIKFSFYTLLIYIIIGIFLTVLFHLLNKNTNKFSSKSSVRISFIFSYIIFYLFLLVPENRLITIDSIFFNRFWLSTNGIGFTILIIKFVVVSIILLVFIKDDAFPNLSSRKEIKY